MAYQDIFVQLCMDENIYHMDAQEFRAWREMNSVQNGERVVLVLPFPNKDNIFGLSMTGFNLLKEQYDLIKCGKMDQYWVNEKSSKDSYLSKTQKREGLTFIPLEDVAAAYRHLKPTSNRIMLLTEVPEPDYPPKDVIGSELGIEGILDEMYKS